METPKTIPFGSKPLEKIPFGSKPITPVSDTPKSPLLFNEQNAPKLEQVMTGAGKDIIAQAKSTSDLTNKVLSFIPENLKSSIASSLPQLAAILGIISKVSPTISKIEKGLGQEEGSLTKLNTGYQKAGAVAERLVQVAPGIASLGKIGIQNLASLIAENKALAIKQLDNVFGTITQGKLGDISRAKVGLQGISTKNINSYSDLATALDTKVETFSKALDKTLETNVVPYKINDLNKTLKVGETEVQHNYIKDALNQLEDFFAKTGNVEKEAQIMQLKVKANSQGLTIKEMNDLARLHGQELSGFNANGELASGLTKQLAENTRAGIKSTARELFGNDAYNAADDVLSDTIQTRDLVKSVEENVNKLKQRIIPRKFGEKVGRLVFQIADRITAGGLKGFVQSFVPRGNGLKVMNALDLEANLNKNLKAVDDLLNSNLPEQTVLQRLEEIQKSTQNLLQLPAPATTKIGSKTVFTQGQSPVIELPGEGIWAGKAKLAEKLLPNETKLQFRQRIRNEIRAINQQLKENAGSQRFEEIKRQEKARERFEQLLKENP